MVKFEGLLCILYWIHMFLLTDALDVYSGPSACSRTLYLNSKFYAGVLNFNQKNIQELTINRTVVCKISFVTQRTYYVAVKFLQHLTNASKSKPALLGHRITVQADGVNQTVLEGFPAEEVVGANLTTTHEIESASVINNSSQYYPQVDVLFYTFQLLDQGHSDNCTGSGYKCINSARCLPEVLACSRAYDFCLNGFKNKCHMEYKRTTQKTQIVKKFEVSYTGLYIFFGCLLLSVMFMVYMCCCRNIISFCKYKIYEHARSGSDKHSGNLQRACAQPEPEVVEEESYDANLFLNEVIGTETRENDSCVINEELSSLPPSYSYLERQGAVESVQNEEDVSNIAKRTPSFCYLPPSYSTVLNHEEDFQVHKNGTSFE